MPTNTPRSIAELVEKWRADLGAGYGYGYERAMKKCADELQALATANGAEGLPEAVLDAALLDMFPGDHSAYLRVNWRDTMRRVLTAAILATRPQAASDGEARAVSVPQSDWRLVATENRPKPETARMEVIHRGNAFVNANVAVECDYETLYRWEAKIGFVGTDDTPPRARILIDAAMTTDAAKGD